MEQGLHWGPFQWRYDGFPASGKPEERIFSGGKRPVADFSHSPAMREQMNRTVVRDVRNLAFYPALYAVDVNNETSWNFYLDLCPAGRKHAREKFGIELDGGENVLPMGRLIPKTRPADGIVPDDDPLYRWHAERKGADGESEVFLVSRMMRAMRTARPDVETVYAPILRAVPMRRFGGELTVAQNWFYRFGLGTVAIQEGGAATVRGGKTRNSSFPGFLDWPCGDGKKRTRPSGDTFRASCWASLLRPSAMLVLFQAGELFRNPSPPGLDTAAETLFRTEIPPFAALIPAWQNRPRRIAFYRSFANLLYRADRWGLSDAPFTDWLNAAGAPYDILFGDDFFRDPALVEKYGMIVAPQLSYLPASAHRQLTRFAADPKNSLFLSPGNFLKIPGAKPLEIPPADDFRERFEELRKKYGDDPSKPAFAEAMENVLSTRGHTVRSNPLARAVEAAGPEALSRFRECWLNVLELDSTRFLGVVNDLRTWGPLFGKFRQYAETGVAQRGAVEFAPELGAYAYDLMKQCEIKIGKNPADRSQISFELGAADAKIVALTPRPVGKITGKIRKSGGVVTLTATLAGGASIPGWLQIDKVPDFSGPVLFRNGKLEVSWPDSGAPARCSLRASATGQTIEIKGE